MGRHGSRDLEQKFFESRAEFNPAAVRGLALLAEIIIIAPDTAPNSCIRVVKNPINLLIISCDEEVGEGLCTSGH